MNNQSDDTQHATTDQSTTHDVRNEAEKALARFKIDQTKRQATRNAVPTFADTVTIRFEFEGESISQRLETELIIGRDDPLSDDQPDLDLSDLGGYQQGISRRHAALRLVDQRLELVDLGSRNGTFLNGERLTPHQPAYILTGDEIRLGKMRVPIWVNE